MGPFLKKASYLQVIYLVVEARSSRSRCQIECVLEQLLFLAYRQMSSCCILMWLWCHMHLFLYSYYYTINGCADKHCQGDETWVLGKYLGKINLTVIRCELFLT